MLLRAEIERKNAIIDTYQIGATGKEMPPAVDKIAELEYQLSVKEKAVTIFKNAWIKASRRASMEEDARIRLTQHIIKVSNDENTCAICPCCDDCNVMSANDKECFEMIEKKVCV